MSTLMLVLLAGVSTIAACMVFIVLRIRAYRMALIAHSSGLKNLLARRKRALLDQSERLRAHFQGARNSYDEFLKRLRSRDPGKSSFGGTKVISIEAPVRLEDVPWDAAVLGVNLLSGHIKLVGDFKDATERFLHAEFESGASLAEELQARLAPDWTARLFGPPDQSLDGWLNGIKGHMGESRVQELLEKAGIEVSMPESGSQAGFDLIFEDFNLQVKTIESFSEVAKHLDEYPDIPVIFNADAHGVPEGIPFLDADELAAMLKDGTFAFDAVALEGFEAADVADAASDGMDAALGTADVGIPFVTIGMSAFREAKALRAGHTDSVTAARNVAVDAAAKAGGMAAGAKVGAIAGSIVAPGLGTAIGGVIGGALGGFLGGRGARAFREGDANAAREALDESLTAMTLELSCAAEGPSRKTKEIEASFRAGMEDVEHTGTRVLKAAEKAASRYAETFQKSLLPEVGQGREVWETEFKAVGPFTRIVAPQRAAFLTARQALLADGAGESMAPVLLDDERFARITLGLQSVSERVAETFALVGKKLIEVQTAAAKVAYAHSLKAAREIPEERQKALKRTLSALESVLPQLEKTISEARKASLTAQAEGLDAFKVKLVEEIGKARQALSGLAWLKAA